jgi:hypothetical protein
LLFLSFSKSSYKHIGTKRGMHVWHIMHVAHLQRSFAGTFVPSRGPRKLHRVFHPCDRCVLPRWARSWWGRFTRRRPFVPDPREQQGICRLQQHPGHDRSTSRLIWPLQYTLVLHCGHVAHFLLLITPALPSGIVNCIWLRNENMKRDCGN